MALSTNGQHYRKMLYFPIGPQQMQFLMDPISGVPPPPFLSLSLTSLMPFAEFFLRGTAEGLSTASSRDGRRGRWEVCPRSARSRGVTLCFARPPAAHAGNRSPARAAPSSRAPTLARGLSSYFAGNWFGLIYQAICLIFCLPAVVLAPSTRILPLQRVPWHTAQS